MKIVILGIIIVALGGISAFAATTTTAVGFGQVAVNIMEPIGLLSDFVNSACFLIGGGFLFAGVIKYVEHRRSPLMVPISTVVFLFLAGLVLLGLPFLSYLSGNGVHYAILPAGSVTQ
jgi:hypothetical protein